jgi:hypothetical protein
MPGVYCGKAALEVSLEIAKVFDQKTKQDGVVYEIDGRPIQFDELRVFDAKLIECERKIISALTMFGRMKDFQEAAILLWNGPDFVWSPEMDYYCGQCAFAFVLPSENLKEITV